MNPDHNLLSLFPPPLLDKILEISSISEVPKGIEIIQEQQNITLLPIVIEGLVRVYSRFEDKEFLLYYIEKGQSCVMTFYAALTRTPSKIYASTEEATKLLLMPVSHLPALMHAFPEFNHLYFHQFNLRYTELLDTVGKLLLDTMDKRIYDYLKKKSVHSKEGYIKMSHSQMAVEIGTAREVVTRMLKKLEHEAKISQDTRGIKIIDRW